MRRPRSAAVVYLCGNDGTGKTTQAKLLIAALEQRGIRCRYVWLRYPQLFSIPILLASRLLGTTRYQWHGQVRVGRWEFYRAPWLARLLLWTQVVDAYLFRLVRILPHTLNGRVVVLDRFVLDAIVDIAAAARDARLLGSSPARLMTKVRPQGLTVLLDADADALVPRRADLELDPELRLRASLYQRLGSMVKGVERVDARSSIEAVHARILELALVPVA